MGGQPAQVDYIVDQVGEIDFLHSLYYAKDGSSLKPVEAMANLPKRKASYFVQDLLARERAQSIEMADSL